MWWCLWWLTSDIVVQVIGVIPVVFRLVKMGYRGGKVLKLGPHEVESGMEGVNNGEKMGGGGDGKEGSDSGGDRKEGSDIAMVCMVSTFGRMQAARLKIGQYLICISNNALMAQLA